MENKPKTLLSHIVAVLRYRNKWAILVLAVMAFASLAALVPISPAAAANPAPKGPFSWKYSDHSIMTDGGTGATYDGLDYICPVGASPVFDGSGTNISISAAATPDPSNGTLHISNTNIGGGASISNDIPKCSGNEVDYAWVTQYASGTNYALLINSQCTSSVTLDPLAEQIGGGAPPCQSSAATIATITSSGLITNFKTVKSIAESTATDPNGSGGTNGNPSSAPGTPTCESSGVQLVLGWVLCGLFNILSNFSNYMFTHLVVPLMRQPPIPVTAKGSSQNQVIYSLWSTIRIWANILILISVVIIVIIQAVSGGGAEVYTAKKILPGLLLTVILVNTSIYLAAAAVDITNVLGGGFAKLILGALGKNAIIKPSAGDQAVLSVPADTVLVGGLVSLFGGGTIAAGAISAAGAAVPAILLFVVAPLAIGLISAFLVLAFRQAFMLLLVIFSPVIFALNLLPSTQPLAKKGIMLFVKLCGVYPAGVAIFAAFDVIAIILASGGILRGVGPLLALIMEGAAFFGFLFAFKFLDDVSRSVYEGAKNFGKRGHEFIKGNPNDMKSLQNRARRTATEGLTRAQARTLNEGIRAGASAPPSTLRGRLRRRRAMMLGRTAGAFGNVDSRISELNNQAAERAEQLSKSGNDRLLYAGAGYKQNGKYYNSKHNEISKLEYDMGKRLYGNSTHALGRALGYHIQKQGQTDAGLAQFRQAFEQNAIANNWTQDEAMDVFAAATYPHKTQLGSEWYSKPQVTQSGNRTTGVNYSDIRNNEQAYGEFVRNDVHKARREFDLSNIKDGDWRAFGEHQERVEQMFDGGQTPSADQITNYAETAEILDGMQRQGMIEYGDGGEINVSGVSSAAREVIKSIIKNRRYEVAATPITLSNGALGASINQRTIYERAPVEAARQAAPKGILPNDDMANLVNQHRVANALVTGDIDRPRVQSYRNPTNLDSMSGVAN